MKRPCALLAFVAAACAADASPPYLVSVTPVELNPGTVRLIWEPAGGNVDSYAIDWRAPGGTFAEVLGNVSSFAEVQLSALPPDVADFEFCIRAEPKARRSNGIVFHRGMVPAAVTRVYSQDSSNGREFVVTYENPSELAAQVKLERRTAQRDGTASAWIQVDVGSAKTNTFIDRDLSQWVDGARYEYRATVVTSGATPSQPSPSDAAPFLAPVVTGFTPGASGSTLTIRGISKYARTVVIERGNADTYTHQVGSIPAPGAGQTASFFDAFLPPGLYYYKVYARDDSGVSSPYTSSWWTVPDPASIFDARIITVQGGTSAVRDGAGRFGVVEPLNPSGIAMFPPGGDGSSPLVVSANVAVKYLLDSAGHPHTVYFAPPVPPATTAPIVHAWHDGTRWLTEEIAQRAFATAADELSNEIAFDIGLDGTLYAVWAGAPGAELARQAPGGPWQVELVTPNITGAYDTELVVSGDESGVPHVIQLALQSEHFFPGAGGWQSERIPLSMIVAYSNWESWAFAGFGRIDLLVRVYGYGDVELVQRTAAGWAAPAVIAANSGMVAARSHDGRAVAIAAAPGNVWVLRDGVTTQASFFPMGSTAIGFSPNGKVWVLEWLPDSLSQSVPTAAAPALMTPAVLFEER